MTFLPIAERELRVAARRKNTFRLRTAAALLGLGVVAYIFLVSQERFTAPQISQSIFFTLAGFSFLFCLAAGTRITADCLSEEKREGTLGLLFLTDLRGFDVVFGKLAATSMNSVYGLLGLLPILAIPLMLGGVSSNQLLRMILVLLVTMFFSLSAGMVVSAICQNERKALGGTFLLIFLFTIGFPAVGVVFMQFGLRAYDQNLMLPYLVLSPGYSFGLAANSPTTNPLPSNVMDHSFWCSLLVLSLISGLFLFQACRIIPRAWQDKPASIVRLRWRERWERWCYGDSAFRLELRRRLLDKNPFLWLAERHRLQKSLLWGFLALIGVGFLWGYVEWREDWLSAPVAFLTAFVLHSTIKMWVVSEITRRFMDMRRDNALELILCAPLSIKDILAGQWMAFRRLFRTPIFLILLVDVLMFRMAWQEFTQPDEKEVVLACFLAGMILFVVDAFALGWVGLWMGLSQKQIKKAGSATINRILVLPWVVFLLSVMLLVSTTNLPNGLSPLIAVGWWFFLGLAFDLFFAASAYGKLHSEFRTLAMQRYHPAPMGWLQRWFKGKTG